MSAPRSLFTVEYEDGEALNDGEFDFNVFPDRASAQDFMDSSGAEVPVRIIEYVEVVN